MLPLIGIAVLVVGFAARLNPLAVIVAAALTSGLLAGIAPLTVIAHLGKAFNDSRYVSLPWLALPVIGLLERYGLQARARSRLSQLAAATPGRLLILYLALRQITSGLGLIALGGGGRRGPSPAGRPASTGDAPGPRLRRGHGQYRRRVRRRHFHRTRPGPADQRRSACGGGGGVPPSGFDVVRPERDRGFPDPRGANGSAG
jgi:hypothetical protein